MGGEHVIDTAAAGTPSLRLEIGRPEAIENHDPKENDGN